MATIKDVARTAGVSTATVSAVVNDSAYVSPELRARVLAAVKELRYVPSLAARNLRHGRSQLIAIAVSDLANPFFSRVVCAAEAAVADWGYSLVVFNSDEKPDAEKRISDVVTQTKSYLDSARKYAIALSLWATLALLAGAFAASAAAIEGGQLRDGRWRGVIFAPRETN